MYSILIDTAKEPVRFTTHTTGQQHAVYVAAIKEGLSPWKSIGEYPHKEITPAYEDYESEATMRSFIKSKMNQA